MASVTLIPSGYIGTSNITVSNIDRGYKSSSDSSSNYATLTLSTSTTGYLYFTFDTSDIPSSATITGISGKARVRVSNTSRVTNTVCQLYSGTTAKGSNVTFSSTSTSNVVTLSPGNASTWSGADLNDLRLRIGGTGSSSGSTKAIYFYGADITITYTVPTHTVTSSTTGGTIEPSGATTVEEGSTYTLTISGITPSSVTDNGTNVTSQLSQITTATETLIPNGNTNSNFTLTNITNAYADADNTTYAQLSLAGGTTGTIYLDMSDLSIPSGATITNVSAKATLQYNRNSSSSGFTCLCQMYAGNTAKGSSTSVVSSGGSDVAKTTFNLTVGSSWTATEINNARFYLTATNNASRTVRYIYIYGVSFDVTYESDGVVYVYTLTNVTTDHTIVVTAGAVTKALYVKLNGSWVQATAVYKKVSGSWVEQSDLTTVFQSGVNYKKGN